MYRGNSNWAPRKQASFPHCGKRWPQPCPPCCRRPVDTSPTYLHTFCRYRYYYCCSVSLVHVGTVPGHSSLMYVRSYSPWVSLLRGQLGLGIPLRARNEQSPDRKPRKGTAALTPCHISCSYRFQAGGTELACADRGTGNAFPSPPRPPWPWDLVIRVMEGLGGPRTVSIGQYRHY
ncbi:hypothetical protein GGR51DRAFT_534313 [Nemania sp. FL0031]|nr:hypothetical protein GGR51DRAFT_534313 [Nemania sp. FL0031]